MLGKRPGQSRYRSNLFRGYLVDETLARDAVQEVFVRTYFNIHRYRPTATFKTWLYTIAVNLCHDETRKMRRQPVFITIDEPKAGKEECQASVEPATYPPVNACC